MQEFSSISVSTYDPDALVGQLNEQVAAGWNVVSIVPTGSTITAYLTRETDAAPASPIEPAAAEPAAEPAAAAAFATEPAPEPEPAVDDPATMVAEPAPEAAADEPFMAAAEPAPAEPAPEPAPAAAAPAGWYADPSSRYELRYWDGSTWTEHVSRGGQQYTDPPVA